MQKLTNTYVYMCIYAHTQSNITYMNTNCSYYGEYRV